MDSISKLGYDFFIQKSSYHKYQAIAESGQPLIDKLHQLLVINPKFYVTTPTREEEYIRRTKKNTYRLLQQKIKNKEQIVFFGYYFNTKPSSHNISGGNVAPDAADLLALLHLNTMLYFMNKIYEPGVVFKVASELNFFHHFAQLKFQQTNLMQETLFHFNQIAEQFVGTSGKVLVYDLKKEVDHYKKQFYKLVEEKKYLFMSKPSSMKELNDITKYYYDYVINKENFKNTKIAWNFAFQHALYAMGHQGAVRDMFNTPNGFFKDFSDSIFVLSRLIENTSDIHYIERNTTYGAFLPGAPTFSFNTLTLKTKDNLWKQITYKDVETKRYIPYFVQDLSYPFFFYEKGCSL